MTATNPIECRLCKGIADFQFSARLLETYDVGYFECSRCGSLQTTEPYWLGEAYQQYLAPTDVGAAHRCVSNSITCAWILEALSIQPDEVCLDWGGGDGLFVRLMRDRGYNFLCYDKYHRPTYGRGFGVDNVDNLAPTLITAMEVFEHLPHPHDTLRELFALHPDFLLFTTQLYQRQGPDWDYLAGACGQHVFFYTRAALSSIGESFGYEFVELPGMMMFASKCRRRGQAQRRPAAVLFEHLSLLARLSARVVQRFLLGLGNGRSADGVRSLQQTRHMADLAMLGFVRHCRTSPWRYVGEDYERLRAQSNRSSGENFSDRRRNPQKADLPSSHQQERNSTKSTTG